jgi:hypothetical protein
MDSEAMNETEILPHILIRMAGMPSDFFPRAIEISRDINLYLKIDKEIDLLKHEVIKEVKVLVEQSDERTRTKWINLKRDLYNNRIIDIDKYDPIQISKTKLKVLLGKKEYLRSILERIKVFCDNAIVSEKENLIQLANYPQFKNGLLLSSLPLFDAIDKHEYLKKKKKEQLDKSLIKYMSRVCKKTSPFSSFTSTGMCTFTAKNEHGVLRGNTHVKKVKVTFNLEVFRQIYICLKVNKICREDLFLKLNKTIDKKEKVYNYLICFDRTEVVQSLSDNETISYVYSFLSGEKEWKYREIRQRITENLNIGQEESNYFLLNLLHNGFLEITPGYNMSDLRWLDKTCEFLSQVKGQTKVISNLYCLIEKRIQYENSIFEKNKRAILNDISSLYMEIIADLLTDTDYYYKKNDEGIYTFFKPYIKVGSHEILYVFKEIRPESLVFEDIRIDVKLNYSFDAIRHLIQKANIFLNEMDVFRNYNVELDKLQDFLENGEGNKEFPALSVFEKYMKSIKNSANNASAGDASSESKKASRLRHNWSYYFKTLSIPPSSIVNISTRILAEIKQKVLTRSADSMFHNSFSTLGQLYLDHDKGSRLMLVLDTIGPGYGRLYNRFFPILSPVVFNDLKAFNKRIKEDGEVFLDNMDTNISNLDSYLSVLDGTLHIPGMEEHTSDDKIDISRLAIKVCRNKKQIEFVDSKTKRTVYLFDQSTLNMFSRSNLFKFLNCFSKVETLYSRDFLYPFNKSLSVTMNLNGYDIIVQPRIIIDNCLVIQRKKWVIRNSKAIADVVCSDVDVENYVNLNKWRVNLEMPNEVFFRIPDSIQNSDDYKPQYVDFRSPVLTHFFINKIKRTKNALTIEEMLPSSDQLAMIDGKNMVTEYLFQWNSYNLIKTSKWLSLHIFIESEINNFLVNCVAKLVRKLIRAKKKV